ncbi:MAG: murein L,D-transpeptidase catalytic domain family protein [Bdellovibrionales bacterium]|nr:murein L,D-transpeptidase catalytic domain family protein [Bdellovibrionales bacterium]
MKISFYQSLLVCFLLLLSLQVKALDNQYSFIDTEKVIPQNLLEEALKFYEENAAKIKNKRLLGIIDFKAHNSKERFFILDMESGRVESYLTAHGKNSDPDFDGYATKFSNTPDSNMSSLGFYLTAETYYGKNGYSLRLDGLSATNSNARARAIVIHGADYVTPGPKIGRSYGCPALEMRYHQDLIDRLKDGALLFAGLGSP